MLQDFRFDKSEYERAEQDWVCGWAADGRPCPIGPDQRGRCRTTCECTPFRKGDRWQCTRPGHRGGKCAEGPLPDGTCARAIPTCQPVRSIRAKRGMAVLATSSFTIGVVLLLFGGPHLRRQRDAVMSPGALSAPHGAIADCAACHALADWATAAAAEGDTADLEAGTAMSVPEELGATAQCLSCHQAPDEDALKAHGLSPQERRSITERMGQLVSSGSVPLALSLASIGPGLPMTSEGDITCATCHREHRGRDAGLVYMDNWRCQNCHVQRFSSFSEGHPEFTASRGSSGVAYGFDHGAHEAEHFPQENAEFTCQGCHTPSSTGRSMLAGSFEPMCADCHTDEIRRDGLTVFQLPGVDYEILVDNGISIGEWPVDAGIDLDAEFSPMMRLLLSADTAVAADLDQLEGVELFYLEGEDGQVLEATGRVAWAIKELFHGLVTNGRDELRARLERAMDSDMTARELVALVDQRDVDQIRGPQPGWHSVLLAAQEEWLPTLAQEVSLHRAGRPVGFREHEDYEDLEVGEDVGWLVDFDFTIQYLPSGHGDVFLRQLLELGGRAAEGGGPEGDLFAALRAPQAPGRCAKCHTIDAAGQETGQSLWTEGRLDTAPQPLTTFDHAPHLVRECGLCHEDEVGGGFEAVSKGVCTTCHTRGMATESCLNCHSYHTERFGRTGGHQTLVQRNDAVGRRPIP